MALVDDAQRLTVAEAQKALAKAVGERLMWVREHANLTPTELGAHVGVDSSAVRHIERGNRMPSIFLLLSLCHVLRVSPQYVLWGQLDGMDQELQRSLLAAHPELRWAGGSQPVGKRGKKHQRALRWAPPIGRPLELERT